MMNKPKIDPKWVSKRMIELRERIKEDTLRGDHSPSDGPRPPCQFCTDAGRDSVGNPNCAECKLRSIIENHTLYRGIEHCCSFWRHHSEYRRMKFIGEIDNTYGIPSLKKQPAITPQKEEPYFLTWLEFPK